MTPRPTRPARLPQPRLAEPPAPEATASTPCAAEQSAFETAVHVPYPPEPGSASCSDPVTACPDAYPDPRLAPWPGFALAAAAAVERLDALLDLDLWMVTAVERDRQVIVASAGTWRELAPAGTVFPYLESFCLRMIDRQGPTAAPDVRTVPAYAQAATGLLAGVRSYIGVPLEGESGTLFGTLCAVSGTTQHGRLSESLPLVELVGQMLSTILSREQLAQARAQEAEAAHAWTDHDPLTGLHNLRGFTSALAHEHQRGQRHGTTASVLAVQLDLPGSAEAVAEPSDLVARAATALASVGRPGDLAARTAEVEFGVLCIACNPAAARALAARLRVALRTAGVSASVGSGTRRTGEDLVETWRRAQSTVGLDRARRRRRRSP